MTNIDKNKRGQLRSIYTVLHENWGALR